MTRKRFVLVSTLVGTALSMALSNSASGQSVDALLDKLVDKGILSVKEANDLKQETDKNFMTALQSKNGMPDWVTSLRFNGDFRGRYDGIYIGAPSSVGASAIDRGRFRYRLRFGAVATIQDDFEVGFRLTSAEPAKGSTDATKQAGGNPLSGNTTLSGDGSKKFIYIDQAYGKWSPLHSDGWNGSLAIGKLENPFVTSDLVFDPDYTPEGAAMQLSYAFNDAHTLRLIGGGFMLNELSASSRDPYFLGAQLRLDSTWWSDPKSSRKLQSSFGVAALSIDNRLGLDIPTPVPNQNSGNTRNVSGPAIGALTYNYNPIVADGSLTYTLDSFPMYGGAFPVKVFGTYMDNPAAPSSKNIGWEAGVTFGKSGKKGLWDLTYRYKKLESDAWYEELVDDDFGAYYSPAAVTGHPEFGASAGYSGGTNVKGHVIKATYSPYDSLTLGVTYFATELVNNPDPTVNSKVGRLFVDAMWKF